MENEYYIYLIDFLSHCYAEYAQSVNVFILIGEFLPVSKTPLPKSSSTAFGVRDAARHVLYAGTLVLQMRAESAGDDVVRALVVRTSFATAKGELLRAMLHPKPLDFVYERHAWYLAGGLALLGLAGVAYALIVEVCSLTLLLRAVYTVQYSYIQIGLSISHALCRSSHWKNITTQRTSASSMDCKWSR